MPHGQSIIKIPDGLANELDKLAGHKKRSAYAIDVLWRDVRRNKQREALKLSRGAWKAQDHPELAQGGAVYVDQIRSEPDERFEEALRRQKR
jgi:hypothetical protein